MASPIEFAPKGLVCFDFDSVLSPKEIIDELAELAKVKDEVTKITELAMIGKIDYRASLEKRVSLIKGLPMKKLIQLAENFPITQGSDQVVKYLLNKKILPVIISGGFSEIISIVNKKIGIPLILANNLEINGNFLTGKVFGPCVTAESKGELLALLVEKFNIPMNKTAAICDGANDINLLKKVSLPLGFRPKEKIKEHIKYHSFNDMREILGYLLIEEFFD